MWKTKKGINLYKKKQMYPYNFKPQETGIKHNEVFIVMPFDEKYDVIFSNLIDPATKKANEILGFTGEMSLKAYRTKDDIRTTSGWINVLEHLFTWVIGVGLAFMHLTSLLNHSSDISNI